MEPSAARRRFRVGPAAVAGLAAVAAAAAVMSPELGSLGGDNAEYCLLAKSLRAGEGYRAAWGVGEAPRHTLYPPVYPLLLVPFVGAAPGSFLAAHLPAVLAAGVAVFLLARLFARRGLPPWVAAAGALAPALSMFWLRCAADLLSELPFLALAAGALLLLDPGEEERLPTRRIAGAAVCAALAFGTRTAGLALAIPVALALVLSPRARGRAGWIAAAAIVAACGGWFLYGAAVEGPGASYGEQLGAGPSLLSRAWGNLVGLYLPGTPAFVFPRPGASWEGAGWPLWGLALAGLAEGFLRRRVLEVPGAFAAVYLAMQAAWPFEDSRFALPLAPFLVLFALEEVHRLAERSRWEGLRRTIPAAVAVLLLLPNLHFFASRLLPRATRPAPGAAGLPPGVPRHEPARFWETWFLDDASYAARAPAVEAFLSACDLVRTGAAGLPPGPVVASNPRVASLLTGRRIAHPPAGASPEEVAALVRRTGAIAVVVDGFRYPYADTLRRYRDARPGDLDPVAVLPGDAALYRVR